MANSQKSRIEFLENGITITNRLTGAKSMFPNNSKVIEYAKNFILESIHEAEPGEYYDIDITVTKFKNKKPSV